MGLDKNYTCALKNTSYVVRFRSSAEQTNLEPISFEWEDLDPSHDYIYGAVYYVRSRPGDARATSSVSLGSGRTSIGTTAMMGLVAEIYDTEVYRQDKYPVSLPSADLALTRNKTLGELVEELSRNVTLSLFSSSRMW